MTEKEKEGASESPSSARAFGAWDHTREWKENGWHDLPTLSLSDPSMGSRCAPSQAHVVIAVFESCEMARTIGAIQVEGESKTDKVCWSLGEK
jgi:hypothetical protein